MNKIKVTLVYYRTMQAINRRMIYATLIESNEELIHVDLYEKIEDNQGNTVISLIGDYWLDKSIYKYEPFNESNQAYKGCVSFVKADNQFLQSKSIRRYKYIILKGSSRSGKTHGILQTHFEQASKNQGWRIALWRDTKKSCKDTMLVDFKKIVPQFQEQPRFYATESYYLFNSKSVIEFNGCDNHLTVHGFQGDISHFNEPYAIKKDTFDQIDMRTREYILIDYNPIGKHWVDDIMLDERAIVIHSTYKDNPFCPAEQRTKIESYQPVSMFSLVLSKQMSVKECMEYDFSTNPKELKESELNELARCLDNERKGSASEYKHLVYALGEKAERPNKIFTFGRCTYMEFDNIQAPKWYGIDWGKVDAFAIAEYKYHDGTLYCNQLNYQSENEVFSKLSPQDQHIIRTGGGFNKEGQDEYGTAMYVINRLGIPKDAMIVCDSNYPTKVLAMRKLGYYNAMTADKGAGSIVEGIRLLSNLNVVITTNSKNFITEEENYSWQVDKYGAQLEKPEENSGYDHLMDTARYVASKKKLLGIIKIL